MLTSHGKPQRTGDFPPIVLGSSLKNVLHSMHLHIEYYRHYKESGLLCIADVCHFVYVRNGDVWILGVTDLGMPPLYNRSLC